MSSTISVYPTDFRKMLDTVPDKSADLVIADWPFNRGVIDRDTLELFRDGVKEAARIIKPNGNFVSVHYIHCNAEVYLLCKRYRLQLRDNIILRLVNKVKKEGYLGRETVSIWVFSKDEHRIFNDSKNFKNGRFFDGRKINTITDLWLEKQFRNGWRKDKDKVSEAMPAWVVSKLLDIYSVRGCSVVDYFGGSGNFTVECYKRGLKCTAAELNSKHFRIINQRLAEVSKIFIDRAEQLSYTTPERKTWPNVAKWNIMKPRKWLSPM